MCRPAARRRVDGLIMRCQGHSRTIIGIERRRPRAGAAEGEYNLLVLDPGVPTAKLAAALRDGKGWQRLLKRGVHTLSRPEYQLLYVDDGVASGAELQKLKEVAAEEWY